MKKFWVNSQCTKVVMRERCRCSCAEWSRWQQKCSISFRWFCCFISISSILDSTNQTMIVSHGAVQDAHSWPSTPDTHLPQAGAFPESCHAARTPAWAKVHPPPRCGGLAFQGLACHSCHSAIHSIADTDCRHVPTQVSSTAAQCMHVALLLPLRAAVHREAFPTAN